MVRLWLGILLCSGTLMLSAKGQAPAAKEAYSIKIGIEEVRLDAVVLDRKGHQIADLTADDFEIRQDGSLQKVTSCIYINEYQPRPEINTSPATPQISNPMLTREDVRRTIVFLVDNLPMSISRASDARMAVMKFVENQMQTGDMISIMQTDAGSAENQMFTSDKRLLMSRIAKMRWNLLHPYGRNYTATLHAAIQYCIDALQDMPGHKSLVLITPQARITLSPAVESAFNQIADFALRAGVVVHTLDIEGLAGLEVFGRGYGAERGLKCTSANIANGDCFRKQSQTFSNAASFRDKQFPLPLSQKTGGIFLENSNFFVTPSGIGKASEGLKGYYLLTYTPPGGTFKNKKDLIYHRLRIRAKRPDSEVLSRDGFFGMIEPAKKSAEYPRELQQAIFSPFLYKDLKLGFSSGYAHTPSTGYFVNLRLHLDGKDLGFKDEGNGSHSLALGMEILVADTDGKNRFSQGFPCNLMLDDKTLARVRSDGIDLNSYMPIKTTGDYYVRAAVKDRSSGKIGSGYQFLEISDLSKGRLALSSIFVLGPGEDASAIVSGILENNSPGTGQRWVVSSGSPAVRKYLPGESFSYAAVVYNAKKEKVDPPQLELQYTIFKDGMEYSKGNLEDVDPQSVIDFGRILIIKRVALGSTMEQGAYALQLTVMDKRIKGKDSTAAQSINFEIDKE